MPYVPINITNITNGDTLGYYAQLIGQMPASAFGPQVWGIIVLIFFAVLLAIRRATLDTVAAIMIPLILVEVSYNWFAPVSDVVGLVVLIAVSLFATAVYMNSLRR